MNSPHAAAPLTTWICPHDGTRRHVETARVDAGSPACPRCRNAMVPAPAEAIQADPRTIPGLAEALAKRDPELQQEPEIAGFPGGMGRP